MSGNGELQITPTSLKISGSNLIIVALAVIAIIGSNAYITHSFQQEVVRYIAAADHDHETIKTFLSRCQAGGPRVD